MSDLDVLSEEMQDKIENRCADVDTSSLSNLVKDAVDQIKAAAGIGDARMVTEGYLELKLLLHEGAEDEELSPASSITITSGRKKRQLGDLLNVAGIVAYYHGEQDDDYKPSLKRDFVFADEQ